MEQKPLRRVLELGPTSQPIVAGLYAWAVTVAPVGFGRHGIHRNWPATIFTTFAFLALVRGVVSEALLRSDAAAYASAKLEQSRTITLFSFATMSLITWILDTDALSPVHLSAARGVAGMLGWALFAYACAAPVVEPVTEPARVEAGVRARGHIERGDAIFVAVVCALALSLQLIGWNVQSPERAMLVRVTTIGAAILLLGGIGTFIGARHGAQKEPNLRQRIKPSRAPLPLGWVVALLLLVVGGILYVLTD